MTNYLISLVVFYTITLLFKGYIKRHEPTKLMYGYLTPATFGFAVFGTALVINTLILIIGGFLL